MIKSLALLALSMVLVGVTPTRAAIINAGPAQTPSAAKPLVINSNSTVSQTVKISKTGQGQRAGAQLIFVGGAKDRSSQIVMNYEFIFHRRYPDLSVRYFDHAQYDEIIHYLKSQKPDVPLIIIGHSWGGETAARVTAAAPTELGRTTTQLITIDPVSGRGISGGAEFFEQVRAGTRNWLNVDAVSPHQFEQSNVIASAGVPWNEGPAPYATSHKSIEADHWQFAPMLNKACAGFVRGVCR